jgi:sugar-specific transcriptional regulator TrmB
MITKTLNSLGLDQKESSVYLALVKRGFASASQLANQTGLPRQTVYSILNRLIELEFIEQSDKRGVKAFLADPNKLFSLLDKQKQILEKNRKLLQDDIAEIIPVPVSSKALPKIQYYEGRTGLVRLFDSILDLYKKGASKNFRGYGINKYKEALGDYLYEFVKKRDAYGVNSRLFIGQGPDDFTDDKNPMGRKVKRLEIKPQKAGLYLVGDRVYLFSFEDNVGVMVENDNIAELLKRVFDDHWTKY